MKILYYLAGIGGPNYDVKINILVNNINSLYDEIKEPIDMIINMYEYNEDLIKLIKENKKIGESYINLRKGVLVELWKKNGFNNLVKKYDYVLFIYDDVKIKKYSVKENIEKLKRLKLDILSPLVEKATHPFMKIGRKEEIKIMNSLEIYFILMKPETFYKYLDIQDIENKWTWGTDFLFGYYKIKCGINCNNIVLHNYPQKNRECLGDAYRGMIKYLNKLGFKNLSEVIEKYPPLIKIIKYIKEKG